MSVPISYLAVVLIWSTTPLAIKLSNDSLSPHAALLTRMVIAMLVVAMIVATVRARAALKREHWKLYLAAALGIFPNMSFVYIAAEYISSGLIAVIFALNPLMAGSLAALILKDRFFVPRRLLAIATALVGLSLIFYQQWHLSAESWKGISLMMLSTLCFSLSQVGVKYYQRTQRVDAVEQTLGALCLSMPVLIISWYLADGQLPETVSTTSLYAVLYLAVIGSVLGFYAYYFVLSHLSVALVSMIPVITPLLALWLGALFLHEQITPGILLGTLLILLALILYGSLLQDSVSRLRRLIRA